MVLASGPAEVRERCYRLVGDLDIPLVILQEAAPTSVLDACAVIQDDVGGARDLTRHLLACGARRFLFVAPSCVWPAIQRRENGIRSMLPQDGSFVRIECEERDFHATMAAVDRFLSRHALPDVIMGGNDQIATAALRVLEQRGHLVPRDVQVTGYNDFPFRNFIRPLLTTVKSAANPIGQSCAQAVLSRLDAGSFQERLIDHRVTLELGTTTATAPAPVARSVGR